MGKVLIACEFSGVVRDAFRRLGHSAWSCDLEPADPSEYAEFHIHGNVEPILNEQWDLIIAHPPCTYLNNAGVCHLHSKSTKGTSLRGDDRWAAMEKGCEFFNLFQNIAKNLCNRVCIENPIPHKYAKRSIGEYTQLIQPWMFGHPEKKATCLWLYNLPKLEQTNNVKKIMESLPKKEQQRIHYMSPNKNRGKLRSITFSGIAEAMASQWGKLI